MSRNWSKELIVQEIQKRYKKGQKLNSDYMQKNQRPLYLAGCCYFGSWKASIEASGIPYDNVRILKRVCPVWSKKKIISIIRKRHRSRLPLNSNCIQTEYMGLYVAARKYFGSWQQAITETGLDYGKLRKKAPMQSWTKTKIVEEIIRRKNEGLSIRGGDVAVSDSGFYHAACRHFGKNAWATARTLAGFEPIDPDPRIIWTKETVCKEIRNLNNNNVDLSIGFLQKGVHSNLLSAAQKVFGSWAKAIHASGLNYSKIRKLRNRWWTRSRVLMLIQSLAKRGIRLSHKQIQKNHGDLIQGAIKYFGCWSLAVEAAGIPYRAHCRVWSTKAWLRKMTPKDYEQAIQQSNIHAQRRRQHESNSRTAS